MSYAANIGKEWACYQVFRPLADYSAPDPTPAGIVGCDGSIVIPDDPSGTYAYEGVVAHNYTDANLYWNGGSGPTEPVIDITYGVVIGWSGVIELDSLGSWGIQVDGTVSHSGIPTVPVFWPSIQWSTAADLVIPDLSSTCCTPPPPPPSPVPTPDCPQPIIEAIVNCDPSSLISAATCFDKQIPKGMHKALQNYLLCQILSRPRG